MKIYITLIFVLSFFIVQPIYAEGGGEISKPKEGFVPNNETAKAIADAILKPLFKDKIIPAHKAALVKGVWVVIAKFPPAGEVTIKISKENGKIISVGAWK